MLFAIVSTHNIIYLFPSKFLLNVNVKYMILTYAKEISWKLWPKFTNFFNKF